MVGGIGCVRILSLILKSGCALIWFRLLLFLQCDPALTPGGSGVLSDPVRIDEEFQKALAGSLPLRYCSDRFAWKLPTWRLPGSGRVRDLVAGYVDDAGVGVGLFLPPVSRASGSAGVLVLGGVKRIRLNRKTPAHLARVGMCMDSEPRSRVWKRLRLSGVHWCSICDSHVMHECPHCGGGSHLCFRVGVG